MVLSLCLKDARKPKAVRSTTAPSRHSLSSSLQIQIQIQIQILTHTHKSTYKNKQVNHQNNDMGHNTNRSLNLLDSISIYWKYWICWKYIWSCELFVCVLFAFKRGLCTQFVLWQIAHLHFSLKKVVNLTTTLPASLNNFLFFISRRKANCCVVFKFLSNHPDYGLLLDQFNIVQKHLKHPDYVLPLHQYRSKALALESRGGRKLKTTSPPPKPLFKLFSIRRSMENDTALLLSKLGSVQEQKFPMSPWLYNRV